MREERYERVVEHCSKEIQDQGEHTQHARYLCRYVCTVYTPSYHMIAHVWRMKFFLYKI